MTKTNSLLITIALILIVLIHLYIGHYFAPNGIDLLPLTMILITVIIFQFTNYKIYIKCLIAALLFLSLDIGLKLYAGGSHDYEGLDWINAFYFIGIIPSLIIIFYKVYKNTEVSLRTKILIVVLSLVFLYFQNDLFGTLGVGRFYPIN